MQSQKENYKVIKKGKTTIIIKRSTNISSPFTSVNIDDPIDSSPLPLTSPEPRYRFLKLFEDITTNARLNQISTFNTDANDTISEAATYEDYQEFSESDYTTPRSSFPTTPKISYISPQNAVSPMRI